jgi:hypothetical protein
VKSQGGSFSHLSVHLGTDWRVDCHTYDDHTPILTVDAGNVAVSFSIAGRCADDAAVSFARALARDVQAFAADIERMHAAQGDAGDVGDDDSDTKAAPDAA